MKNIYLGGITRLYNILEICYWSEHNIAALLHC